jgi:hypothetical protein
VHSGKMWRSAQGLLLETAVFCFDKTFASKRPPDFNFSHWNSHLGN